MAAHHAPCGTGSDTDSPSISNAAERHQAWGFLLLEGAWAIVSVTGVLQQIDLARWQRRLRRSLGSVLEPPRSRVAVVAGGVGLGGQYIGTVWR